MATQQAFIINQTKIGKAGFMTTRDGEIVSGRLAPGTRLDLDEIRLILLKISKMPIKIIATSEGLS